MLFRVFVEREREREKERRARSRHGMMHLRFLVPTPICPPCLVFGNRCERVCEEEEKERCGAIYIFISLQLPRTAHHACDSFTSTNPTTSLAFRT
jgi:hypothetical protein